MSKLFQIKEDDLAELESALPKLADAFLLPPCGANLARIRRVQRILSDVRWNYGPPSEVESQPAGGEG